MTDEVGRFLPGMEKHYTPVNDHIFSKLRSLLKEFLPSDQEYETAFDRFEYLFGLVSADAKRREFDGAWMGPVGCFAWRGQRFNGFNRAMKTIEVELETEGSDWGPLKAGLFGGSLEQAKQVKAKFDAYINKLQFH